MRVIQTELSEAIADLAAKVPGARISISVHNAPVDVFTEDVRNLRVVSDGGRTWLSGQADGPGYRVDFYSADLPKAEQDTNDADVIPL